MIKYVAIVLAAGMGKRMNRLENKQFLLLKDKPLIIHTLSVFEEDPWCDEIILVTQPKEQEKIANLISDSKFATPITLVDGGRERQLSVFFGLQKLQGSNKIVFIHDGARPFVSQENLHKLAQVTVEHHAALLAVPVTDTIKQRNGKKLTTLNRATLWAAQTPQAFQFDLIWKSHQKAKETSYIGKDDASLVEQLGHPVEIVEGSYRNIKITTPEDLKKALYLLEN